MSLTGRTEDSASPPGPRLEEAIAAWTGDRPRPEYWIETGGIARARSALDEQLRSGAGTVLVTGETGSGKTTLLRSFWHHPPKGFATVFVPALDVSEPNEIAACILAATRRVPVHDAAGALSRMLRTHALRGSRPVMLVDDLHDVAPAALAKLLALVAASGVDVGVVAAGAEGEALDARAHALPQPVGVVSVDDPWTREDAERLIARIGASLSIGAADLLGAIDVPEAMRASGGNPRLLRAALAAQLRQLNPRTLSAMSPPDAAPHRNKRARGASSEPAPLASLPAGAAFERVSRAEPAPRKFPGHPPRRPSPRPQASERLLVRAGLGLAGALAASVALGLFVERAPAIAGWSAATLAAYVSDSAPRISEERSQTSSVSAAQRTGGPATDLLRPAESNPRVPVAEAPVRAAEAPVGAAEAPVGAAEAPVRAAKAPVRAAKAPVRAAKAPVRAAKAAVPAPTRIRVAVNSDPWSNLEVDGVEAGSTPLTIELEPGLHRFRAAMADGRVIERKIEVTPDRNRIVLR